MGTREHFDRKRQFAAPALLARSVTGSVASRFQAMASLIGDAWRCARTAMRRLRPAAGMLVIQLGLAMPLLSQTAPMPKREFRGAWIATVANLDWPVRGEAPDRQKALLVRMLDGLKDAGINAVFFQVRTECDALYDSAIEPWSYWLTGQQGKAPDPWYDPLAFAVKEAHKRGLELHAWFNPYRASRDTATYEPSPQHVRVTRPEWIMAFGKLLILDPGRAAVRDHVTNVVMDVVRRYDIDGVHMDDYFYPYPPDDIGTEDAATFEAESRGFTSLAEWRRDNVNSLIAQLADSIWAEKPAVKFGISPFGIWRDGVPVGIRGMDAYEAIYADPLAWVEAGTVDYLIPQLYWPFGGAQDYGKLAPWWSHQVQDRHLYIGQALHRTDSRSYSGTPFTPEEIPAQIRLNRKTASILGNVFFRARNITHFSSHGIVDRLRTDFYRYPALTPSMPWKSVAKPGVPRGLRLRWQGGGALTLSWDPAQGAGRYAVYRVVSDAVPDLATAARDARNLLAVTGRTTLADRPGLASDPYFYFVQAVGDNSLESGPGNAVSVVGRSVAAAAEAQALATSSDTLSGEGARITFRLDDIGLVSLHIYGNSGQLVRTLADRKVMGPGRYAHAWDGKSDQGVRQQRSVYFVELVAGGRREARPVVLTW